MFQFFYNYQYYEKCLYLGFQNYFEILNNIDSKYRVQLLEGGDQLDERANIVVTLPQTVVLSFKTRPE